MVPTLRRLGHGLARNRAASAAPGSSPAASAPGALASASSLFSAFVPTLAALVSSDADKPQLSIYNAPAAAPASAAAGGAGGGGGQGGAATPGFTRPAASPLPHLVGAVLYPSWNVKKLQVWTECYHRGMDELFDQRILQVGAA